MIESISKRQVIRYVKKLPDKLYESTKVFLGFLKEHSKHHFNLYNLIRCGEGGQSFVLIGDVPGINVVIKAPINIEDIEMAMDETQFIDILYDKSDNKSFVVQPREELIICNEESKEIVFYCAFFERLSSEMHEIFP